MKPTDVSEELVLTKGAAIPFDLFFFDPNDAKEDLSIYDRATLSIREEEGGADILARSTQSGNLSINVSAGKLNATLTQLEADGLKVGLHVMDIALRETASGLWRHIERAYVRIVNSWSAHPA